MASILSFDEANKLYEQSHAENMRSMPFEQFFGEMDLSETQIRNRISTARRIYSFALDALIALYYMVKEGGWAEYNDISESMKRSYSNMLLKLGIPFTAMFQDTHVEEAVADIVNTTLRHTDEDYYFTKDRARLIAENEANSVWNDSEYKDAILTGHTMKTWVTMRDKRVRDTHKDVDGVTIPINDFFHVGEAMLLYPRYSCPYPEEIVNCRCSVSYS